MTHFITKVAIASIAIIGASSTAHASDTFTARFDYDASISAADNLKQFERTAENTCNAEFDRAGYRVTEATFKRRKCARKLVKKAVRATGNDALTLVYADLKNQKRSPKNETVMLARK